MTPLDVFFGIQALVKLGQAGRQALEQAVRDRDIVLPLPIGTKLTKLEIAQSVLLHKDVRKRLLPPDGDLQELAEVIPASPTVALLKQDPVSQAKQIAAANAIVAADVAAAGGAADSQLTDERAGLYVVRQWVGDDGPPSPLARVGLALAEIALDYAAAKPSLFGAGASGEKLIAAVALNLGELLPDPDNPADWRNSFAERATAIVFQATLKTLSEHADVLIDDKPLADLAKGLIKPIVELGSQNPGELPRWSALRDTLLGPVAAAAAQAVIDNQAAWLGEKFAPDEALGAVTKVLLQEAVDGGLRGLVTDAGLTRVYKGVLGTIAANPALIVGKGDGHEGDLVRDLLGRAAKVLADAPEPFEGVSGAVLLEQAVAAFATYLPKKIDGEDPWSKLAVEALTAVLDGVKEAATGGKPFLTPARVEQFARLLFTQAAATPEMIVGSGDAELKRFAGALFTTLASDKARLLSDEMWLDVASTALREVAKNPGALIGVEGAGDLHQLGFDYLSSLLNVAAEQLAQGARKPGNLLFGETLAQAAKATLEAAAENAAKLGEANVQAAYKALLDRLTKLAVDQAGAVGAESWLKLFGELVAPVLRTGELPEFSDDELLELLFKEAA